LVTAWLLLVGFNSSAATISYSHSFVKGWNLVGNSVAATLDVKASFGTQAASVTSVWKWNASTSRWAFYAPSLDSAGTLASYCASKGYDVLTSVAQGEGFWVNAAASTALGTQSGNGFALTATNLSQGWNLAATGDDITPVAFSANVGNVTTLWAWDSLNNAWFFYAPSLAASNGLASYISNKGYQDFGSGTLGNGRGFWVNYAGATEVGNKPGLNPDHGTVGSKVTIIGSGFGSNPQVKFYDEFVVAGYLVRTEVKAVVDSSSDTQIVVTVPAGANSGAVKVNSISVGDFTVDLPMVGAWTQQEAQGGYSLATNGTNFVKVWSPANVKQSTTGITWDDSYAYVSNDYMGGQVQWDGSQFVYMVSRDATSSPVQTVAVSPDGSRWVTKVAGQKLISWDQQYASSMRDFVAILGRMTMVGDKGGIATSTDGGTTWTLEHYPVFYQDHQIFAVDDTGSQRIALTLSSDGGTALQSDAGGAWSVAATGLDLKPVDLLWTGTVHIATGSTTSAGGGTRVLRSSDGKTWTTATLPDTYANGAWRGAKLAKQGSTLWLLAYKLNGVNPIGSVLLRSIDDGLNWTLDTDFGNDAVSAIAFGTSLWMAVGNKTYTRAAP